MLLSENLKYIEQVEFEYRLLNCHLTCISVYLFIIFGVRTTIVFIACFIWVTRKPFRPHMAVPAGPPQSALLSTTIQVCVPSSV